MTEKAANPYLPILATVKEIIPETPNIKSFQLEIVREDLRNNFKFEPGQVAQLSVFGTGESTFVINSSPAEPTSLQFSVMKVGEVTSALHELSVGDVVGIRAPLGNWFPYKEMEGKDLVLVAGGLGLAPLRPLILYVLANRGKYGNLHLIYGARSPDDLCYKADLKEWQRRDDFKITLTIDREVAGWEYRVGFVPTVLAQEAPSKDNAVAVTCGPPIMIKFVLQEFEKLKFSDEQIITTLERRMKCGIGLCGRCNIGPKYVCLDGPVFTLAQLKELPSEL